MACDHSSTTDPDHSKFACRWCGKPIINPRAWLCGECNRPAKLPGYLTTALSFFAASLLLPIVLAFFTFRLGDSQQIMSAVVAPLAAMYFLVLAA